MITGRAAAGVIGKQYLAPPTKTVHFVLLHQPLVPLQRATVGFSGGCGSMIPKPGQVRSLRNDIGV